jgi:hypothetical protein
MKRVTAGALAVLHRTRHPPAAPDTPTYVTTVSFHPEDRAPLAARPPAGRGSAGPADLTHIGWRRALVPDEHLTVKAGPPSQNGRSGSARCCPGIRR